MPIESFAAYLADDSLPLPGVPSVKYPKGKNYTAPAPDAELGLKIVGLAEVGMRSARGELTETERQDMTEQLMLDDSSERALYARLLGSAWDQMIADGVSWPNMLALGKYAVIYYGAGPESAEVAIRTGALMGKELPPNRAARRAKKAPAKKAAARKTPPRASTAGTTARRGAAKA